MPPNPVDVNEQLGAGSEEEPAAEEASGSVAAEVTPPVALTVFDLGECVVNLRGGGRVLRVTIGIEVEAALADTLHTRNDELRDAVLLLASDYSYTELEGMEGKLRLRADLHARLNGVLAPNRVERVYFTQFVVE